MDHSISEVERIFGYVFTDRVLCAEALQMAKPDADFRIDGKPHVVAKNARLAILGDAVNDQILCEMWYHSRNPIGRQTPEMWSKARDQVLGNPALARLGKKLGVGPLIYTAPGVFGLQATDKMLATTVEAIFGAIKLDGGESAVVETMKHLKLHEHPAFTSTSEVSAML